MLNSKGSLWNRIVAGSPLKLGRPVTAWYALIVLTLVTLFAVVDRQVLILQSESVRAALGLSDAQLGLVNGTSVAVFTGLAVFPLAWLADRYDRRAVLIGSIFAWSLGVIGCGLAGDFVRLFAASSLVAAGEAAVVPIAYALIPALFAENKRQTANSTYALATSAGTALAMILGGLLIAGVAVLNRLPGFEAIEPWRLSLFAAAAPAPLMMLLVATIPLGKVGGGGQGARVQPKADGQAARGELGAFIGRNKRTFLGLYFGIGMALCGFAAVTGWFAIICLRLYGQSPAQVGAGLGTASLIALPLGFFASLMITRLFKSKLELRLPVRSLMVGYFLSGVLLCCMLLADSAFQMYVIAFGIYFILVSTGMFLPTALQNVAPAHLRARAQAVQMMISAGVVAVTPPLVGLISDQLGDMPKGLLYSSISVGVVCLAISIVLLRFCESQIGKTVADARDMDAQYAAAAT